MGRLLGSLASKSASDLGGVAIAGALQRAGIGPDQVQYVIMGHVLQAGAGQITARQAAVAAGIAMDVPALTVNKVCLSGLDAIALASQLIRLGEYDVIVAGGMESMTQAPHLLKNSRAGYKYGPVTVEDSMALDGLTDAFDHLSMGESTERAVPQARPHPRRSRTSSRPPPTSAPRPRPRTACSPPRSSRYRCSTRASS